MKVGSGCRTWFSINFMCNKNRMYYEVGLVNSERSLSTRHSVEDKFCGRRFGYLSPNPASNFSKSSALMCWPLESGTPYAPTSPISSCAARGSPRYASGVPLRPPSGSEPSSEEGRKGHRTWPRRPLYVARRNDPKKAVRRPSPKREFQKKDRKPIDNRYLPFY